MADRKLAKEIANRIAIEQDADVVIMNCGIDRERDREALKSCLKRKRRKNVLLFLVTEGGDPDAAYRMARFLQDKYQRFTIAVPGYCKSAGTLLVLGATDLAFSENGELGPLDVQMAKKDELWESESGLTVTTALTALRDEANLAFEKFFLEITAKSSGRITVFTASDIAARLTEALFAPITDQIDPLHMGEAWRSMAIGREYGIRLMRKSRNFDMDGLETLLTGYPSHGFVIDRAEAQKLFRNVREFTPDETALCEALGDAAEVPEHVPIVQCLSEEPKENSHDDTTAKTAAPEPSSGQPSGPATETG